GVADVAEVDARDQLLWGHVRQQLPQGLALHLRVQVPYRIDERRRREVDRAFLGTDPSQLLLARDGAPESAHIGRDRLEAASNDDRREGVDRGDADFGASAQREGQAMAFELIPSVGLQDYV